MLAAVTPETARIQLEQACSDVRLAGPGIRNAELNRRAQWVGRIIGAGLLAPREAEAQLTRAAREAGLSSAETRATLASAFRSGAANPVEAPPRWASQPTTLPQSAFAPMAEWLLERCPLENQTDVLSMVVERGLEGGIADAFALPPAADQAPLVAEMVAAFGRDAFMRSGIAALLPSGELDAHRLVWPAHRLGAIWRDVDGDAQTIERRHVGHGETDRRWVFPRARGAAWPLGAHLLASAGTWLPVAIVEGPTDYFALRAWSTADGGSPSAMVVALPSAAKLKPEWIELFADRDVVIGLDGDEAGDKASAEIAQQLSGIASSVVRKIPKAKDWSAAWERRCARSEQEVAELTAYLIAERQAIREEMASGQRD